MKLHFVEEMDQVLKLALEGNLPELHEETPEALAAAVLPVPGIDLPQPVSHQ
jgi:ATP-dependent Lon protease